jgi:hypothetical protein
MVTDVHMTEPGGAVIDEKTKAAYEAPKLTVLGSVHDLTLLQNKKYGYTDGFAFQGTSITNASP